MWGGAHSYHHFSVPGKILDIAILAPQLWLQVETYSNPLFESGRRSGESQLKEKQDLEAVHFRRRIKHWLFVVSVNFEGQGQRKINKDYSELWQ